MRQVIFTVGYDTGLTAMGFYVLAEFESYYDAEMYIHNSDNINPLEIRKLFKR